MVLELRRLVVSPSYLRKGIGSLLVDTVKEYSKDMLKTKSNKNIELKLTCLNGKYVPSANPACQLYMRSGFNQRPSLEANPTVPMCEFTMTF